MRIAGLANALRRACDFGLLMGHAVTRAEQGKSTRSKRASRTEQERVRAAAVDILSTAHNENRGVL